MAPIEITTKKQAIELLQAVVEEKGSDYVDPNSDSHGCLYAAGRSPGCIIGHVLHKVGVQMSMLHRLDQLSMPGLTRPQSSADIEEWSVEYLREHGVVISDRARRVFAVAQTQQDRMKTWGEALRQAKQVKVTAPPVE